MYGDEEFNNMTKIKKPKKAKVDYIDHGESTIDIMGTSGPMFNNAHTEDSEGVSGPMKAGYQRVNQSAEHKSFYKSSRLDPFFDLLHSMYNNGYEEYDVVNVFRGGSVLSLGMSNIINKPINILKFSTYDGNDTEPIWLHLDASFKGNKIIICEDIIDTYGTLDAVIPYLKSKYNPSDIQVVTLVADIHHKQYKKYSKDGITIINDVDKENSWYVFPWEFDHFN